MQQSDYPTDSISLQLDTILKAAIDNRASDIHFEPEAKEFSIRFRVDGELVLFKKFATAYYESTISRIKVLAKLDITNHRFPQDGGMEFTTAEKTYNLRVSTVPTQFGETVVLRILNVNDMLLGLDKHGLEPEQLELLKRLIMSPHGLVLVTGPTGSGKSSLIYSILNTLNSPAKSIATVEDPIELTIPNIRQAQVNDSINLTYATILRSLLRQDPDIAMIGEIRDADTLQMTIQLALTGVLAFSTFHSFDVPALIVRFMEMGIPRSVVAQVIRGVISTRLLKRNCTYCIGVYTPNEMEVKFLGQIDAGVAFKKGNGCVNCKNTGYLGRVGIFEIIDFDNDIKTFIIESKPTQVFFDLIKQKNTKSLKTAAIQKVVQGVTTLEEIIRVIGIEG